MDDLISYLTDLRDQYPAGKVKTLLGGLIADCKAGAPRAKIMADAEAVQAEHPGSTVARAIDRVKLVLG